MTWYDEVMWMLHESNLRMMQQIDEAKRKRLQLETTAAGWLTAPRAEEFRGVGTYRWACTSPKKMDRA